MIDSWDSCKYGRSWYDTEHGVGWHWMALGDLPLFFIFILVMTRLLHHSDRERYVI